MVEVGKRVSRELWQPRTSHLEGVSSNSWSVFEAGQGLGCLSKLHPCRFLETLLGPN